MLTRDEKLQNIVTFVFIAGERTTINIVLLAECVHIFWWLAANVKWRKLISNDVIISTSPLEHQTNCFLRVTDNVKLCAVQLRYHSVPR